MSKVVRNFQSLRDRGLRGFTLIELLIVIAIILILIAIALPNFLEAQERARVVRANGHLRSMETAVMSHITQYGYLYSDYNDPTDAKTETRNRQRFMASPCPINPPLLTGTGGLTFGPNPPNNEPSFRSTFYAPNVHCPLTTPILLIDAASTVDPWSDGTVPVGMDSRYENGKILYSAYFVSGPDRHSGDWVRFRTPPCLYLGLNVGCPYSPTNGTKSPGDLWFVVATDTAFAKNEYIPLRTF